MRCPYCGERNPNGVHRCHYCGRRLDRTRKQNRKEKRIIMTGIFLIVVIVLGGIAAMYFLSDFLEKDTSDPTESKVTITTQVTPTPTPVISNNDDATQNQEQTETTEETVTTEPLTAALSDKQNQIDLMGYSAVTVSEAAASSTIQQYGVNNDPSVLYDGNDKTSWQEGVDGYGEGENVTLTFDKTYKVRFITVKTGNWRSNVSFQNNGRPQTMTFEVGEETFTIEFPDEQEEYCIELSRDVEATHIKMTIDSVYEALAYPDTCINEVVVYGY